MGYQESYQRSIQDPQGFWSDAARAIDWYKPWDTVLDDSNPPFYRWFAGAELNTCYNALDRHVAAGRGDQDALIYDSPVTDTKTRFTYLELLDQVSHVAGALTAMGIEKGDRVIIYMPMVPETVMAMLACARSTLSYSAGLRRASWPRVSTMRNPKPFCPPPAVSRSAR